MAYYFLFPEIDTTLYSHPDRKEMNAGSDELLEIVKERGTTNNILYPSRIIVKFKNEEIKSVISDTIGSDVFNASGSVNLQLTSAESKNIAGNINLNLFAISQSWDEGTGRYTNLPSSSNGASWRFRHNTTVSTEWTTSSFGAGSTGSVENSTQLTQGGGVWYTGSGFTSTQQFLVGDSLDTNFDVTTIVKKFSSSLFANEVYPTGIENNGFLVKKPKTIEENISSSFGELQYFSVDTHTIHPPKLCFKWDDSVYRSGQFDNSLIKRTGELSVSLYRNKQEYNQNDEAFFRIHVRDKYPIRTFTTSSNYLQLGFFKSTSFYSVRDAHTEQEIIPFDENNTKLSADSEGMFFRLYMKGFQPERYYRILFKHVNDENTIIYDDDYFFKVVR
jgi:hypothetical protein